MIFNDEDWINLQEQGYTQQQAISILNEERRQIHRIKTLQEQSESEEPQTWNDYLDNLEG